ncbi:TetR/AcrR family transcriptional regulator [Methylobacillus gramineus]|uniref:TetR/AcrR family transcriptional regulator n=1 Tax=Methylobacillus gramineus TaxID=755169 RepID=UPI001CFF858F|nr:TetR/AcrR family transcriptional regulator [Methylobacillus gramineus]MCB5185862.1 TetR/AcrR family transcriptional regulator [Methylobacillus gramineus]
MSDIKKPSLKQRQFELRESAILDAVDSFLASKGFDLMTMDEISQEVGISKASLYKHFDSKELLAAATMTRLIVRTLEVVETRTQANAPLDNLKMVVAWSVREHLEGRMPSLPSTRSSIHEFMMRHQPYVETLERLTEILGGWILDAQQLGLLNPELPGEVILYTIYARPCDPVTDFLKMGGALTDEEIVNAIVSTCFNGLKPS